MPTDATTRRWQVPWTAPEVWRSSLEQKAQYSIACDVFSLGMVYYFVFEVCMRSAKRIVVRRHARVARGERPLAPPRATPLVVSVSRERIRALPRVRIASPSRRTGSFRASLRDDVTHRRTSSPKTTTHEPPLPPSLPTTKQKKTPNDVSVLERAMPQIAGCDNTPQEYLAALRAGRRPPFARTPPRVAELVGACWATDEAARPKAGELAGLLQQIPGGGCFG